MKYEASSLNCDVSSHHWSFVGFFIFYASIDSIFFISFKTHMFYATVNITFVKLHQTDNCVQKKQNYTLSFHVAKIFFYSTCTSLMKDKNWVPVSNAQEGTDILLGNTSRFQLNKLNSKTTSSKTDTGQRLFNIKSQF